MYVCIYIYSIYTTGHRCVYMYIYIYIHIYLYILTVCTYTQHAKQLAMVYAMPTNDCAMVSKLKNNHRNLGANNSSLSMYDNMQCVIIMCIYKLIYIYIYIYISRTKVTHISSYMYINIYYRKGNISLYKLIHIYIYIKERERIYKLIYVYIYK